MNQDLTEGKITSKLLWFALPLMIGNLLQQFYNIADTLIVGRYLGADALAAVGSSYTLMVFLTSILIGLCMGSSVYFSILYGKKQYDTMKNAFFVSFVLIASITIGINIAVYLFMDEILHVLQIPSDVYVLMKEYLFWIFSGIGATFLYNYFANAMRSMGNSMVPLLFLALSTILNIVLDLYFVVECHHGIKGAAIATVIAQYVAGIGIMIYGYVKCPYLRIQKKHMYFSKETVRKISSYSFLTCLQQSIMNLGILAVQGLVNTFGTAVMAAFAAAVKIDSFAYMPVQDFGNAFSTFVAQNYGAKKEKRLSQGIRSAFCSVTIFSVFLSIVVCVFAKPFMEWFVSSEEVEIVRIGVQYLRVEGAFYIGIGILFLLYGYYRAIARAQMSVVLTILSLGTRVVLAYVLSSFPSIGVIGIWASVPIGWFLADAYGLLYYRYLQKRGMLFIGEN